MIDGLNASGCSCPVCNSNAVAIFIEIPGVPRHCNLLWSKRSKALDAPRGDIRLGFCGECGHIFNVLYDPAPMKYNRHYENSLHFSPRFQKYAGSLACRLIEQYDVRDKDIIEIGCGRGEFLKLLCDSGSNRGIGFDRSHVWGQNEQETTEQIKFIQDFYSEKYAHYRADLICCRQVLEHIHDPMGFLALLRRNIGNQLDAVVFFEVPDSRFILKGLSVWDIIYEHFSYFNPHSLERAFLESGFSVRNMSEEFEGQFLCIEAVPCESPADTESDALETLEEMARDVETFSGRYDIRFKACKDRIMRIENAGQRAIMWGAGSKGVSLLNTLKIRDQIEYVVDINPRKQNMYIAGTGQKIVPPAFLSHYKPDFILVTNPIYEKEIRQIAGGFGLEAQIITI